MNDKPRTMMLGPHEWRTLVMTGATNLYTLFQSLSSEVPTAEQTKWFHDQLDRLKMQVSAWGASGQQPHQSVMTITDEMKAGIAEAESEGANGTGAGITGSVEPAPKKKRGWQKGRKRGPRKPKQGEAVQ